jgi:flagellar biosynthesis protein FlhF
MRVKRYEAESMQEAIMKVRAEFGRDAVILHSKKFRRGGAFGLFGRQVYEVIAGLNLPNAAERKDRVTEQETAAATPVMAASPVRRERRLPPPEPAIRPPVPAAGEPVAPAPALVETLASLRRMLHELSAQLAAKGADVTVARGWEELRNHLLKKEIRAEYVAEIEEEVFRSLSGAELGEPERVAEVVRRYFLRHFMGERRKPDRPAARRVIALVGPTGVGKTTTVAKLAAQHALFGNRAVGLLTVDTYRIAAVDQLKTYAEIINLPVEVAFSPAEAREALARLSDREIILMDTAGRSQNNGVQMAELQTYLEAVQPDEVQLVLSTTTKQSGLDDCLSQFRGTGYQHLIFTKLDETDAHGTIFNCAREAHCPITYLTFGQNVPDDIEEASHERLADLLLGQREWAR